MSRDAKIEEAYARVGAFAAMLEPDKGIDRRNAKRVVPMEVLALGMSRTGTLSLHRALTILGYAEPYHFSSQYKNILDTDMWLPSLRAKQKQLDYISDTWGPEAEATPERIDEASSVALNDAERGALSKGHFDALLGHCSAVTDSPANIFHYELITHYPEAKVVLTDRDIDKWKASMQVLIDEGYSNQTKVLRVIEPRWFGRLSAIGLAFLKIQVGPDHQSATKNAKEGYRKHYAAVRRETPKERLLEYELGSGWQPICDFLGKEVPTGVEFPRLNESNSLKMMFGMLFAKATKEALKNMAVVAGAVAIGVGLWFRYRR